MRGSAFGARAGRLALALGCLAMVASCGGGGSGGSGGGFSGTPTPSPVPTPTPTVTPVGCSLSERQDWALTQLNDWYLFPSLIDTSVNKASYSDLQSYVDALLAPARAQSKDRYFTYITSIAEEDALINSGETAGFGFRLGYDTPDNRVFVIETFEGTPAFSGNISRGDELVSVGNQSVAALMASGGPQAVIDALGPDDPGVARTFSIRHLNGVEVNASLTKATYDMNPVSTQGNHVIDYAGTPVGYINLRTFVALTGEDQLRTRIKEFKDQGIDKVIVDLRYNGGGLIEVSQVLGSLLAANQVNKPFAYMSFRPEQASNDETLNFQSEANAISATRIAFIGTQGSASASELVMNALAPYLGKNVALVGSNTYGKPVGQIGLDNAACDDRFRVIAFALENADHYGGYFSGLAVDATNDPNSFVNKASTCRAVDDISHQLGDPNESSVAAALNWLGGASCTAIAGTGVQTTQALKSKFAPLQPTHPSATQERVPGLY
jgi:carboxyl-terminal processing protease